MALTPGDRFGSYVVVGPIGAGGMGEVYRAHDSRLRRDVALKVLPDAMRLEPGRLARFEQEARALAALNLLRHSPRLSRVAHASRPGHPGAV